MSRNKLPNNRIDKYLSEFKRQSINPPGNDPVIAACYKAIITLAKTEQLSRFLRQVLEKREVTPTHFVNLFFRAIQYLEIYHLKNDEYPHKHDTAAVWKKELKKLTRDYKDLLEDILLNRDTTTTIYQRYAGAKIILNALFGGKDIKIADFGCGGNYGIPGLAKNLAFDELEDRTKSKRVTEFLINPLAIMEGTAVDKEDPQDVSSKAWLIACSFYPQELAKSARMLLLEAELHDVKRIKFVKENVLSFNSHNRHLLRGSFDAVIMSTFLYQLTSDEQKIALEQAKKLLAPNGVIIIQDFAAKNKRNPQMLTMKNSWFSKPYLYRTFISRKKTGWKMREILRWNNGRCKAVREGTDFYDIIKGGENN